MTDPTQHKKNNTIPTVRMVTCPACNKNRLGKYENSDGTIDAVSDITVDVRGEERYLEVCSFCVIRYHKIDERFMIKNMHKLSKAIQNDKPEDGTSDYKDFSLN